eukprot:GFUD01016483.1.p1 GENE.GFUD01016483.1~~GFUD01016483.1.p1  ORF type:complete len:272 (+),score=62.33 GFUD01016483.1:41-856(+)
MSNSVILVGGNLVSDTDFRKKLAGRDAGVELQMVVEDLLARWEPESSPANDNESVLVEKADIITTNQPQPERYLPRDQLKITLKIFLTDCHVDALFAAVKAALSKLATNRVDMLFVATPVEAIAHIGIGSGAVGPEQAEAQDQLLKLWKGVEQLIQEGKVGGAGLCDLHPPVFIHIYEEATIKPISIQVNLKSCCVVPEELSSFAKDNKVTLLTHSDPGELLPGDCLRNMLYPKLSREAGHFSAAWIARYQVHLKDRGVLLQKRYLIELSK